ncbi:hypothetical protein A3K55_02060 [Candidatus Shapirobacteria bacterium RBG_13_44_7]|uniref:Phosphatidic acid phosphatase type 2/haloperoxidase domain-containing protein n=1 Tax=Candidatus Shapirobacteria bacterium RBG_13_44_7 TaxID=1802149 RepID=A0A1F7SHI2_9BACT|nr:MAG: hypothetical protein A3K55_02060 [Candidatus Shapirobacteria bacterium RBG_13_44_7]
MLKKLLFWQPKKDYYHFLSNHSLGKNLLVSTNYLIWVFLFYVSYLLIKNQTNIFWQLLIATIASEVIEKILKLKDYWKRPAFTNGNQVARGLIKAWYTKGSFPSGHTIKAVFFLLFILQYPVISLPFFLLVIIPLLAIRVLIGFHYPIDVLGGIVFGIVIWFFARLISAPLWLNQITTSIFNLVFFIH